MPGGNSLNLPSQPVGSDFKEPVETTFNAAGEVDLEVKISHVDINANIGSETGEPIFPTKT